MAFINRAVDIIAAKLPHLLGQISQGGFLRHSLTIGIRAGALAGVVSFTCGMGGKYLTMMRWIDRRLKNYAVAAQRMSASVLDR
jgi:hypothetical protein